MVATTADVAQVMADLSRALLAVPADLPPVRSLSVHAGSTVSNSVSVGDSYPVEARFRNVLAWADHYGTEIVLNLEDGDVSTLVDIDGLTLDVSNYVMRKDLADFLLCAGIQVGLRQKRLKHTMNTTDFYRALRAFEAEAGPKAVAP